MVEVTNNARNSSIHSSFPTPTCPSGRESLKVCKNLVKLSPFFTSMSLFHNGISFNESQFNDIVVLTYFLKNTGNLAPFYNCPLHTRQPPFGTFQLYQYVSHDDGLISYHIRMEIYRPNKRPLSIWSVWFFGI